jgi:hypothetical protein
MTYYLEVMDNFLSNEELEKIDHELANITWPKLFDRAGSRMYENTDLDNLPVLKELSVKFSSPAWLQQLEKKLGIKGILPDPYITGAGYSEIRDHGDLKPHIDFNWNDDLKMYRVCSLIIYLSDGYEGGELVFEDRELPIPTSRNRAVIWQHSETVRHMVTPVVGVRRNVRFFYYASMLDAPKGYHRSLYGMKDGRPVDFVDGK